MAIILSEALLDSYGYVLEPWFAWDQFSRLQSEFLTNIEMK